VFLLPHSAATALTQPLIPLLTQVGQSTLLALDVATFEAVLGPYMKLLEAHYNVAVLSQVRPNTD